MQILPLTEATIDTYVQVGITSYREHYLHLWKDSDPTEYFVKNLTQEVVSRDIQDPNLKHFIVKQDKKAVGILKFIKDSPIGIHPSEDAILLEKIYLLASYAGQGIGSECMAFAVDYAKSFKKKILWLDTMKDGRPLPFYLKFGFEIVKETRLGFPSVLEEQRPMYVLQYRLL